MKYLSYLKRKVSHLSGLCKLRTLNIILVLFSDQGSSCTHLTATGISDL